MSFIPTNTTATSGAAASAAGNCRARTSPMRAPVNDGFTSRAAPSASRSSIGNPRHPPPGTGSPSPTQVESPSVTSVRTGRDGTGTGTRGAVRDRRVGAVGASGLLHGDLLRSDLRGHGATITDVGSPPVCAG